MSMSNQVANTEIRHRDQYATVRCNGLKVEVMEFGDEPLIIVSKDGTELYRVFSDLGANIVKVRCLDELEIDAGGHTWRCESAQRELDEAARAADAGQ